MVKTRFLTQISSSSNLKPKVVVLLRMLETKKEKMLKSRLF
jgi:hypothetical protein